jgi:hypothetical protein
VLGHQADNGLIGVVVGLLPEDEDQRAGEHDQQDNRGRYPALASRVWLEVRPRWRCR